MSLQDQGGCYECGISNEDWELLHQGPLSLIGEVKDDGVVWFNQNPHAWPKGTKFYAQLLVTPDDTTPSSTEA